ncbi:hypothetical protein BJ912DRAFT_207244 [Pholiota molesta]|nr:hypothetical protein BJ912DRAFT_207244 [Pholiota molesta]
MVLCVTQHAHSGRFDEDVWVLAAPHEARHLITAGIFAQYILQPGRVFSPLLCYEAWDYIVSVMIMILNREVLEEEETLALVTSTPLCFGLEKLVRGSGTSNRQMMLSSPWTSSMEILLAKLLNNGAATESYFMALKRRLACAGESLLTEISIGMKDIYGRSSEVNASEVEVRHHDRRLVYYRDLSYSGLLYVCGANT